VLIVPECNNEVANVFEEPRASQQTQHDTMGRIQELDNEQSFFDSVFRIFPDCISQFLNRVFGYLYLKIAITEESSNIHVFIASALI
jgi:hypothetical protein